jgi:hypothetical protein
MAVAAKGRRKALEELEVDPLPLTFVHDRL